MRSDIDGETPHVERAATLEALDRGEIQVVSNVFVLTEGWDCSRAKVCLLEERLGDGHDNRSAQASKRCNSHDRFPPEVKH